MSESFSVMTQKFAAVSDQVRTVGYAVEDSKLEVIHSVVACVWKCFSSVSLQRLRAG